MTPPPSPSSWDEPTPNSLTSPFWRLWPASLPSFGLSIRPTLTYFFPATAGQGQELEITAGGTFKDWPVQVRVEGRGLTLEPAEEKGKFTLKVEPDATPGRRLIRLYNEAGASELKPFTIGTLSEIAEQEPNDEPTKPHKLDTLPVAVYGRLAKRGDVDTFAIELTSGQTLVAALDAQRLGSPMDGVLQLRLAHWVRS